MGVDNVRPIKDGTSFGGKPLPGRKYAISDKVRTVPAFKFLEAAHDRRYKALLFSSFPLIGLFELNDSAVSADRTTRTKCCISVGVQEKV